MKLAYCAIFLLFAPLAAAQEPAPRFIVHTVDGPTPAATLLQIENDFSLQVGGAPPRKIAGKELVSLRQESTSLPRFLTQNVLVLNNGDRVPVDTRAGWRLDQDRLYFRPGSPLHSTKELDLSVNYLAVFCLGPREGESPEDQEALLSRLLSESRTRDVVLLMDGDRVEGILKSLDSVRGATLNVNGQESLIALARIKAIAFNTEFKARPRGKGPFAQIVLAGGGRLGLSQIRLESGKDQVTGTTLFGSTIQLALKDLRAVDIRQGPAVYLSDLPCTFEQTPFLSIAWPLGKDCSVSGKPLRLGQDTFAKGLGMHSQSQAKFRLDGKFRWFESDVGLDTQQGQQGRVRIKVLIDGKERELGTAGVIGQKTGPFRLRLDVRGAKELILNVDFADFGDVQGHVNWANARLIQNVTAR